MSTFSSRPDLTEPESPAADPALSDQEWLETDGCGGFACGTVTMCPTRRYHGLLLAPRPGTATRHLYLAHFDEQVLPTEKPEATAGRGSTLSARQHAGDPDLPPPPPGLVAFTPLPWPRTRFVDGTLRIDREILVRRGAHEVLLRYAVPADGVPVTLELRPRIPMREADALTFRNDVLDATVTHHPGGIACQPYLGLPAVHIAIDADSGFEFTPAPDWDCGVAYAVDLDRGYDGHEDLFSPGRIRIALAPGGEVILAATVRPEPGSPMELTPRATWRAETARRGKAVPSTPAERCALAADDFLYTHPVAFAGNTTRRGIFAGFPWFVEWGRDTFIALPGLSLARGRPELCAEVLRGVLPYLDEGLIPNIFGATKEDSHYGSVDAALWFARAALLYDRATGDRSTVDGEIYPSLLEIADHYAAGTGPRIRALGIGSDAAGMVFAGDAALNPTWMDAKPASGAVTPRHGCPVEIAGLWYSLLCQIVELATGLGDEGTARRFAERAASVEIAFRERFWLDAPGYLADVWRPDHLDTSVRPNMVLAASLEFAPWSREERRRILDQADRELLTPVGLRTLSPEHPDYIGRYGGGTEERDGAYHQGTVWPWLLGCYCEATLRVDPRARPRLRRLFDGVLEQLDHTGLNHISEVFDGDAPHRPGGTFAQAWNTGEVLRSLALLDGRLTLDPLS